MSADVTTLSFEAARTELEEVVERLESGSATLEESLVLWERGESLHRRCQTLLDDAQARLDALRSRPAGAAGSVGDATAPTTTVDGQPGAEGHGDAFV
jgi:exodeoxyribonuclease VII small subunit